MLANVIIREAQTLYTAPSATSAKVADGSNIAKLRYGRVRTAITGRPGQALLKVDAVMGIERCSSPECRVRTLGIVEFDPSADASPDCRPGFEGMKVDVLIFLATAIAVPIMMLCRARLKKSFSNLNSRLLACRVFTSTFGSGSPFGVSPKTPDAPSGSWSHHRLI